MATETTPRQRTRRDDSKKPYGHPAANVYMTDHELAELIRKTEGNVDELGIRRVRFNKTDPVYDDVRLANYEELGYSIEDKGYYFELRIQQSEFEKREKARQAADLAKSAPRKKGVQGDKDFSSDVDTALSPVSAADLIAPDSEG